MPHLSLRVQPPSQRVGLAPTNVCHPGRRELVDVSVSWASSQVFLTSFGVR